MAVSTFIGDPNLSGPETRYEWLEIQSPTHPDLVVLSSFWEARADKDGVVIGRDLPSRPIARLLRNLIVVEPDSDHQDYRVRLAGSASLRRFGRDISGERISEHFGSVDFVSRRDQMRMVQRTGKPIFCRGKVFRHETMVIDLEFAILPATSPDGTSRWIVVGLFYFLGG